MWIAGLDRKFFEFPGQRVAGALAQQFHGDNVLGIPGLIQTSATEDDVETAFTRLPKPKLFQPPVVPPLMLTRAEAKERKQARKKGQQPEPVTRKTWR
jgi:hypothetical protein